VRIKTKALYEQRAVGFVVLMQVGLLAIVPAVDLVYSAQFAGKVILIVSIAKLGVMVKVTGLTAQMVGFKTVVVNETVCREKVGLVMKAVPERW
jgi:hypothetical protein